MAGITVCDHDYPLSSEPDDDLKCLICLQVAQDPLQHESCGKLFCRKCLEEYGRYKPCPNCRQGFASFYKDTRSMLVLDGSSAFNANLKQQVDVVEGYQRAHNLQSHQPDSFSSLSPARIKMEAGREEKKKKESGW